jgi:alcohol dehydrogenase class IV
MPNKYMFQTAGRIIGGCNSIKSLNEHLGFLCNVTSALLITQPSLVRMGFEQEVVNLLRQMGISTETLTDVRPEPTIENIKEIHDKIKDRSFDFYIGMGGGSVLDATKILAVLQTNDSPIEELLGTDLIKNRGIPTVLIPTTSGTGSEVTPNAIVTLPDEELKVGMVSRHLLPDLVIIDPVLTVGLPKPITAATGMDAFTHSFESFISNKANPISDMFALESIRLITQSISKAYHDGTDLVARENMMIASMYGGMALTSAGTAAVHALAYPLGGKFHIPHGVANSMLLPHVTEFNLDAMSERLIPIAAAMGYGKSEINPSQAADFVIGKIIDWTKELEIPQNLNDFGVTENDLTALSEAAMKVTRLLNNNPKQVLVQDAENIFRKLLP